MSNDFNHITVLLHETVDSLGEISGKSVVDCTLGGGGHTDLLLQKVGPTGHVIAFDRDHDALHHAQKRFAKEIEAGRLTLIDAPFSQFKERINALNLPSGVHGIIADIGVSSHQIDQPNRGFSFVHDGPLDMRMNDRDGQSAAEFLNEGSEEDIANVIYHFGEEHKSRQIAHLICNYRKLRPFKSTLDLANLIERARLWKEKSKKHPATKTFQALRIFINDELKELTDLIQIGFASLNVGGRMSIISFHSLEDRIVKEKFLEFCGKSKSNLIPRGLPLTADQIAVLTNAKAKKIGSFPDIPSDKEIEENPRSRSAKLRTIEKTTI